MTDQISMATPRAISRAFDPEALIAEWRQSMQADVEAGDKSPDTAATYDRGMRRFWHWFQGQDTYRTIGSRAVQSWRADMRRAGLSINSINAHYNGVRAFFAWAVNERHLAYNPTAGITARGGSRRHRRDPLSDAEVLRVLRQPDPSTDVGKRDKALLCTLAYLGARVVEVQRVRLGDLRSGDKLRLAVRGKGRDEADEVLYLVHPDLLEAMYDWLAVHPRGGNLDAALFCGLGGRNTGQPLTRRSISRIVKAYYRMAGVIGPRKTVHSLRHSLVTNLIRHGASPTKIMSVTRHRSLDTILSYAHEVDREANPAEALVDYGEGK